MEELTRSEEKIMHLFWKLKSAFVKDIISHLPDNPKPPYSTISSVVRILEKKKYLGYKAYGKTYEYFPLISKTEYRAYSFKRMFTHYFDNSASNLFSFLVKEEKLTAQEVEHLLAMLNEQDTKDKPTSHDQ